MFNEPDIDKLSRKGPLILDRYYMSNMAYAKMNFAKQSHENHPFLSLLEKINHAPVIDCVIFLKGYDMNDFTTKQDSHFTPDELNKIQCHYRDVLHKLRDSGKIKCFETILSISEESRNKDLFNSIEKSLIKSGFL